MELRGKVKDGVVHLDSPSNLPDGTEVRVEVVKRGKSKRKKRSSLSAVLLKHAGKVKGMPSDLARNHDHYIHGTPKRPPPK
ncbi:MAG TPA: hypothetical protein VEK08_16860 [Planctomycetota bacterium]|nr:hypothetical protein [Planctomycetota bacterium]